MRSKSKEQLLISHLNHSVALLVTLYIETNCQIIKEHLRDTINIIEKTYSKLDEKLGSFEELLCEIKELFTKEKDE